MRASSSSLPMHGNGPIGTPGVFGIVREGAFEFAHVRPGTDFVAALPSTEPFSMPMRDRRPLGRVGQTG